MYYATKIKMQLGCSKSYRTQEIESIYIDGSGYCTKASLYDYLQNNPNSIKVNLSPFPYLVPALSSNYEKYVRSESNDTAKDNLLALPRE